MKNTQSKYNKSFKKNIVALHQNGNGAVKGVWDINQCDISLDKALFGGQGRRQYCYDSKAAARKKRSA